MSKRLLYKLQLSCCFIALAITSMAQVGMHYKARLASIEADNFYKVILAPHVIAKCQPQLADVRIIDEKGNQVPYIIKTDVPVLNDSSFTQFPIISSRREADKQTHIIIQNKASKEISNLWLVVKNTEAKRTVTLSGSDDQQQWFVIKENIGLQGYSSDKASFVQALSFPAISYPYFQITILGQNVLPVNIIKAGIYNQQLVDGKYVELPPPQIKQKDSSNKHSYISLSFDDTYQADQLELAFAGTKYFRRNIKTYPEPDRNREPFWFVIHSGFPAVLRVRFQARQIIVDIDNEDNPPIKVQLAKGWQLSRYMLAYLAKGKDYTVYFGDSSANAPKYDIEFFNDSIGKNIAEVNTGNVEIISQQALVSKTSPVFNKIILWVVIATALLLLLSLTLRMTKEVGKRKEDI